MCHGGWQLTSINFEYNSCYLYRHCYEQGRAISQNFDGRTDTNDGPCVDSIFDRVLFNYVWLIMFVGGKYYRSVLKWHFWDVISCLDFLFMFKKVLICVYILISLIFICKSTVIICFLHCHCLKNNCHYHRQTWQC